MSDTVVLDTNVLVSGLRSSNGASYKLLRKLADQDIQIAVSVPLVIEYEAVLKKQSRSLGMTQGDIDDLLDYLCSMAQHREIFFLWRPVLTDPKDDMVLELAVESEATAIITHNVRDFREARKFDLKILTPREYLERLGR